MSTETGPNCRALETRHPTCRACTYPPSSAPHSKVTSPMYFAPNSSVAGFGLISGVLSTSMFFQLFTLNVLTRPSMRFSAAGTGIMCNMFIPLNQSFDRNAMAHPSDEQRHLDGARDSETGGEKDGWLEKLALLECGRSSASGGRGIE